MADQNHGFRKFIMDPKTSVLTYLAENIGPSQQQQQGNVQAHGIPLAQQPLNQSQGQYQSGTGLAQQHNSTSTQALQPESHPGSLAQHASTQLAHVHPIQSQITTNGFPNSSSQAQLPYANTPTTAGHFVQYPNAPLGYQAAGHEHMGIGQIGQVQAPAMTFSDHAQSQSRPSGNQDDKLSPAERLYYRMMLDFETTKFSFFLATSSNRQQDTMAAAYKLESLSRRLWNLRAENAGNFERTSGTNNDCELSRLYSEHLLWAATVLDIQENQGSSNGLGSTVQGLSTVFPNLVQPQSTHGISDGDFGINGSGNPPPQAQLVLPMQNANIGLGNDSIDQQSQTLSPQQQQYQPTLPPTFQPNGALMNNMSMSQQSQNQALPQQGQQQPNLSGRIPNNNISSPPNYSNQQMQNSPQPTQSIPNHPSQQMQSSPSPGNQVPPYQNGLQGPTPQPQSSPRPQTAPITGMNQGPRPDMQSQTPPFGQPPNTQQQGPSSAPSMQPSGFAASPQQQSPGQMGQSYQGMRPREQ